MCGETDTPFRQRQAEMPAHRPSHPWIALRFRRPRAIVQAAEDDKVGALQTRLKRSQYRKPRVFAVARTDGSAPQQFVEDGGVVSGCYGREVARRRQQAVEGDGEGLALFVGPEAGR